MNRVMSPAEAEANKAFDEICKCINEGRSFLVEAGAGAGKTHSLISALRFIVKSKSGAMMAANQQVACITYTNVAKGEIESRTDHDPIIYAGTIHSFCWMLIKPFQNAMRNELSELPNWKARLEEVGGIKSQIITYDLGFPKASELACELGHDDVIEIAASLLKKQKFKHILTSRFPIIFIDEYQDTNEKFASEILAQMLSDGSGPIIGFFGDHWQKIYRNGCGKISHPNLTVIDKRSNFRSAPAIVSVLNSMRPELPQMVVDPTDKTGEVLVFHTNDWTGDRQTGSHWKEDLPPDVVQSALDAAISSLDSSSWRFEDVQKTKVLMLTHSVLASRQGYDQLLDAFDRKESLTDKEDDFIEFFTDTFEPTLQLFAEKRYGMMFSALSRGCPTIRSLDDKSKWAAELNELAEVRRTGTVGEVIAKLKNSKIIPLPSRILKREKDAEDWLKNPTSEKSSSVARLLNMRDLPYSEVSAATEFLRGLTPYSTQHGVKGAEFENVLIVLGRGWNLYNFGQMLEWAHVGVPNGKQEAFERSRNLFYVACSRPKKRLALLFTQSLSASALATLSSWFGKDAVAALEF